MDAHSLKVLEYGKVLERLAAHTSNALGRETALALTPSALPEIVSRWQQETREARAALNSGNGMPLGGIRDVRESVQRASVLHPLTGRELLDIAQTAASGRRLKSFLTRRAEEGPLLAEIAQNIPLFPQVESEVERSIGESGEVKDSATPELARIRSQLKTLQNRLRERLNSILASERYRPYIQESVITIRDGRYCIPVKSEYRSHFGGIVHDASASGATVFVEPASCVETGNEVRELQVREEQETHRVLRRLTELVGVSAGEFRTLLEQLGILDAANAKALLAEEMQAVEPRLNREGRVKLIQARHPLLTGRVVPIDFEVGDRFNAVLITGPNTGGKTVTLKTVGLLTLMAQSGLQIPASADSEVALFEHVFADIGDEQDIQQSLSTFSAHLKNIARIFARLSSSESERPALVLLDEIGAGTDPAEGAALAKALLKALQERGARVVATTHYGELKEFAYAVPGIENASVEFDPETLRPTYHVLLGVPGSSHAFYIAERLGLPPEIIHQAREHLSHRERSAAEMLQQIEESRRRALEMEREAEAARRAAQSARDEYEIRAREVADIRRTIRIQAEEEARATLRRITERAENVLAELQKMNKGARKGASARRKLAELRREAGQELAAEEAPQVEPPPPEGFKFQRGDRVRVTTLGLAGELLEDPKNGEAVVQMGAMRATLPLDVLRPETSEKKEPVRPRRSGASEISMRKALHISPELNLRALRVEEAAPMLDRYLDDAYTAGIPQARVIHGKGTGALRRFVTEHLQSHPVVASTRSGDESEGGEGVTIVTFRE